MKNNLVKYLYNIFNDSIKSNDYKLLMIRIVIYILFYKFYNLLFI